MRSRDLAPILCLLLMACGRALGSEPDAGPEPDARPDARPVVDAAGPDAGPGGCTVPQDPAVIVNEVAPALALSAVALPDGRYAVGAAVGWSQDMVGRLILVDRADLAVRGWASLSEPYVHAGYDPQRTEVVVAAQDNGTTTIQYILAVPRRVSGDRIHAIAAAIAPRATITHDEDQPTGSSAATAGGTHSWGRAGRSPARRARAA